MKDYQRLKEAIGEIKYREGITQKAISEALGYKNQSYLSDIINGRFPLTDDFVMKLSGVYTYISSHWLLTGEGEMLKPTPSSRQPYRNEVSEVPEENYIMVEYADLRATAGKIGGSNIEQLPETRRRLIPREYENGNYLVVRVDGDSMYDGTARSLSDGDEILIRETPFDQANGLPIRTSLFVITSRDGNVLKQITEINREEGYIVCHSFNSAYKDFTISFDDIYQFFRVQKIVQKQISLM